MNFKEGRWNHEINVTDFVKTNITPYEGDASFLAGPTERTKAVWNKCLEALAEERANNGVRSLDPSTVSTITSFAAGYIDKDNEVIVGLQTDEVLRRAIKPFGGIKVVEKACRENGVEVDPKVKDIFTHYRKTHNDGVFDAYTEEIRSFRSLGFLTGLPDNYARGRIIGDYRRLALYGIDRLIEAKQDDLRHLTGPMTDERIRLREEVAEQIKALKEIKVMGQQYGLDLSRPATTAQEAVQWVYMAYLAAVKEQDGAAMSLGNVSSFLDIYIEYDMAHGNLDELHAQELIDQFVIKLRMVRHLVCRLLLEKNRKLRPRPGTKGRACFLRARFSCPAGVSKVLREHQLHGLLQGIIRNLPHVNFFPQRISQSFSFKIREPDRFSIRTELRLQKPDARVQILDFLILFLKRTDVLHSLRAKSRFLHQEPVLLPHNHRFQLELFGPCPVVFYINNLSHRFPFSHTPRNELANLVNTPF